MRAQAAEITISSAVARARVHRSFIHRHPDLRAAVIAAAEEPATSGPALQQENLDLRRHAEEHDEELAAAREANRRLLTELNKARS